MKQLILTILLLAITTCCTDETIKTLSLEQQNIQQHIPTRSFIAHRGTCTWAPEHTEAAMRWARNAGATYLECDIQRTADGYLVLYHDQYLLSKSDISNLYPNLAANPTIGDFTLEELFQVDFGSWFNRDHADYARSSFSGLDILTLEDLTKIAEGYRIKRDAHQKRIYHKEGNRIITEYESDPADNGNRPGIYVEIKYEDLYPNIEQDLKDELERLGWYADHFSDLKSIHTQSGCTNTANTSARVVLQTFSLNVLKNFNKVFSQKIPFCFLVAESEDVQVQEKTYRQWINNAVSNNAVIIAPSIPSNYPDNFADLLQPWMYDLIKESGLLIHAFTFQDKEQIQLYEDLVDGLFCNQVNVAIQYFKQKKENTLYNPQSAQEILNDLGY